MPCARRLPLRPGGSARRLAATTQWVGRFSAKQDDRVSSGFERLREMHVLCAVEHDGLPETVPSRHFLALQPRFHAFVLPAFLAPAFAVVLVVQADTATGLVRVVAQSENHGLAVVVAVNVAPQQSPC